MGFIYVIIASILLGIFPSIQKYVMLSGATPLGMVIICNSTAGMTALLIGLLKKESFRVSHSILFMLAITGVLGLFVTDYLLNIAYTMLPVGFATMIHFSYPSVVCCIMTLVFKNPFSAKKMCAILCSIIGLMLLTNRNFSNNTYGVIVAIVSAFSYAFYIISNDCSSIRKIPLLARSFYLNIFVVLSAIVLNAKSRIAVFPHGVMPIGLSILIGVMLCTAIILLNSGIRILGAEKASFINTIEPITSLLVSSLFYQYKLSAFSIIGTLFIISSLFLIARADFETR